MNLKNPVLDVCKFNKKETAGVWKLDTEFTVSHVKPELSLLQAEKFPSLIKGSDTCPIEYLGPKQTIYNATDRNYRIVLPVQS